MQTEIQTMPFHTSTCPPKTPDIKQSGGYHAVFTSASRCLSIILSFFLRIFRSPFLAISQTNQHRMHIHILHTYIKSAAITLTHKAVPSLGQWKTVAMAAHPEPCCRMIRRVMLLNQPPFSALLCSSSNKERHYHRTTERDKLLCYSCFQDAVYEATLMILCYL